MKIEFSPIGIIHSPFSELEGMPIQPAGALDVPGTVEVFDEFRAGLDDLDGFSHVVLLYHLHHSRGFDLRVVPFLDTRPRGLFATRAPRRPNAIGLLDILDGTPLLDIKPYVPEFHVRADVRVGWLEKVKGEVSKSKADRRFDDG
ncbi:MAG: SAM-dependent methyltransferase [Gemmatimonadota bacterium]